MYLEMKRICSPAMFLILSSLTILATVTVFRALSGLWDVCMTTEEVAALSLQMLGDFPTICLCARFMLVIVRQGKVSGVYVWTALVAVAWIFLAKIESGNMKCFLENLFTGMEVHTLVGVLFFLFSLPFYIAFAFTLKDLFGRRTRAVFLVSAILWSAAGCRTMDGTSGLMLIGANLFRADHYVQTVFGPLVACGDFRLSDDGFTVETTFEFRDPDGYNISLIGYRKDGQGAFVPDVMFPESESTVLQGLEACRAEIEIVISQKQVPCIRKNVSIQEVLQARRTASRRVLNHYPLLHVTRKEIDPWKPVHVMVRVVKNDVLFGNGHRRLALAICGVVVL